MNMGFSERRLPRLAPLVLLALVAGLLFPLVPASAQDDEGDKDYDIWLRVVIGDGRDGDAREGALITLTFSLQEPPECKDDPDPPPPSCKDRKDRNVHLALSGTAQKGSDYTITGTEETAGELYSHKVTLKAADDFSTKAQITVLNDREAEQCEIIKIEAIQRKRDGVKVTFLGITLLYIPRPRSGPSRHNEASIRIRAVFPPTGGQSAGGDLEGSVRSERREVALASFH